MKSLQNTLWKTAGQVLALFTTVLAVFCLVLLFTGCSSFPNDTQSGVNHTAPAFLSEDEPYALKVQRWQMESPWYGGGLK